VGRSDRGGPLPGLVRLCRFGQSGSSRRAAYEHLHGNRLLELPGVTGVGIGEQSGKPTIVIMVKNLTPDVNASLPQTLEGHPVFVEESGEITAF
jgi:hypothetical protein